MTHKIYINCQFIQYFSYIYSVFFSSDIDMCCSPYRLKRALCKPVVILALTFLLVFFRNKYESIGDNITTAQSIQEHEIAQLTSDQHQKSVRDIHTVEFPIRYPMGGINYREACPLDFDCFVHSGHQIQNLINISHFDLVLARGPQGVKRLNDLWLAGGKKRDPKQVWVSSHAESVLNGVNFAGLNDDMDSQFNWTIYRSENATINFNMFHVKKTSSYSMENVIKEYTALGKTKSFCWAINNCNNGWTKRVDLGIKIIRNLPEKIHMWGMAPRTCFSPVSDHIFSHGSFKISKNPQISRREKIQDCKFYFSLENSNCSGYITEKFSNALLSYAVPIVNGWLDSYEKELPGSFIHVSKFRSMAELGNYLDYLLKNETAYFEYHKWRLQNTVIDHDEKDTKRECTMCRKMAEVVKSFDSNMPLVSTINSLRQKFRDGSFSKCNTTQHSLTDKILKKSSKNSDFKF
ncbi:uncharacterized protein LOC134854025 isoform X2 [Symsagittifera roscoffensis]|uniref:uncharacterized protein LOC134854025 isoform X2 n=1 Tax=Symsagittifera roscoffensis TaxID=84072 RepID=UPI00307B985C